MKSLGVTEDGFLTKVLKPKVISAFGALGVGLILLGTIGCNGVGRFKISQSTERIKESTEAPITNTPPIPSPGFLPPGNLEPSQGPISQPSNAPRPSPSPNPGSGQTTLDVQSCPDFTAERSRFTSEYQRATQSLNALNTYLGAHQSCDPCQDGAGPGGQANEQTPPICLDFSAAYDFIRANGTIDSAELVAILRGYDPRYAATCAGVTSWLKSEYTDWFIKANQIFIDSLAHAISVCH